MLLLIGILDVVSGGLILMFAGKQKKTTERWMRYILGTLAVIIGVLVAFRFFGIPEGAEVNFGDVSLVVIYVLLALGNTFDSGQPEEKEEKEESPLAS